MIADYTYGLGLTSQVTAQGSDYYDFDGLGSTVGLTNASQTDVNSYAYTPFGGSLSSTQAVANPFQFLGEWGVVNDGNGLDDMRARAYDSSLGQFTSSDPIGAASGQVGVRAYAGNDPVNDAAPGGLSGFRMPELVEVAAASADAVEAGTFEASAVGGPSSAGGAIGDAYVASSGVVADAYTTASTAIPAASLSTVAYGANAYQDALESWPAATGFATGFAKDYLQLPDEQQPSYFEGTGPTASQFYDLYDKYELTEADDGAGSPQQPSPNPIPPTAPRATDG